MNGARVRRTFSGERLRAARKAAGIGQRDAARRLEISRTTIWTAESGDSIPGGETLGRMADLYGVATDEFYVHVPEARTHDPARAENGATT